MDCSWCQQQPGHLLDALHMEERLIVVQSREAVLQQQVTQAELRAPARSGQPAFPLEIRWITVAVGTTITVRHRPALVPAYLS